MHGQQVGVGTVFDGTFPVAMDQDGALFGVLYSVTADVDERLDDVVECVHIVVVEYKAASIVLKDSCLVFRLGTYVWLVFFHFYFLDIPEISCD